MKYILYKEPISITTLNIVQYLYSLNIDGNPIYCIERNYPNWVHKLPSIETDLGEKYIGEEECLQFYKNISNIENIKKKANEFKNKFPNYKIHH